MKSIVMAMSSIIFVLITAPGQAQQARVSGSSYFNDGSNESFSSTEVILPRGQSIKGPVTVQTRVEDGRIQDLILDFETQEFERPLERSIRQRVEESDLDAQNVPALVDSVTPELPKSEQAEVPALD